MMFAEPQPTPFDIDFRVAGVPVRVSGLFWIGSIFIGWGAARSFARGDQRDLLLYLAIWTAAVLVSILVHEMGHALAYRRFGQDARIVLYHFGGLAIPESWGRRRHLRPAERFLVSAAGPVAQLLLAAAVVLVLRAGGYVVPFPIDSIGESLGFHDGRLFASPFLWAFADFLLFVNVMWPLLNLMPVPPLDGGQMLREGLEAVGVSEAGRIASGIGAIVGGGLAWLAYTRQETYLAVMFAMLAVACYQTLQQSPPWRRWN
jgi:Zn-dependent protease